MKNCITIFGLGALLTSSAFGGLIIGGDFSTNEMTTKAFGDKVAPADVNTGFVSTNDTIYTLNGVSATDSGTNSYGSYLVGSNTGNPGGFMLGWNGSAGAQTGRSTVWAVFSLDTTGSLATDVVTGLQIDVTVLTDYTTSDDGAQLTTGAALGNPANLNVALYGFSGDFATLSASLNGAGALINNSDRTAAPAGYANYTQLLYTNLGAVSNFSDIFNNNWESRDYAISTGTSYDYYILGIGGGGQTIRGVAIDNISISAVPEPSTYIVGLGFIGLGYFIYRRRKQAANAEEKKA